MKGCAGQSWRDFGQLEVSSRRSAAWIDLLNAPPSSPSWGSPKLQFSTTASTTMFLDPPKSHSTLNGSGVARKGWDSLALPYGGMPSPQSEFNRRAALDFVLELAGPRTVDSTGEKMLCSDAFVCGDELPVPMFAVDRDMHCTMWNRRLEDLSNWSEGEVMAMKKFPSCTFKPRDTGAQKQCEDILKNALFGRDATGVEFVMRSKDGAAKPVCLFASLRADAVGAVSGVLCVVMPHSYAYVEPTGAESRSDGERLDEERSSGSFSDSGMEPSTPTLQLPVGVSGEPETMLRLERADFAKLQEAKEKLERCVSAPEATPNGAGALSSPKALVVDTFSARRNSLAMQLERCGLEVACASSAREATWRFGQSLTEADEGPAFAVVFVDLQAESRDGYAAVREVRRLENILKSAGEAGDSKTLIVAVTSMNRWDLAGMDTNMDKSMSAGVDAVIPQNIKMQQLRSTLRKLGLRSKYLDVPTTLPRALSGQFHNPLNLSR